MLNTICSPETERTCPDAEDADAEPADLPVALAETAAALEPDPVAEADAWFDADAELFLLFGSVPSPSTGGPTVLEVAGSAVVVA